MRRKSMIVAAAALAIGGLGTGIAIASGAGDDDKPLTSSALEQATNAALAHTGGGTVIETEAGDDGAAYGVEVRLDSGRVVEVALDERFQVVGTEEDDDLAGADEPDDR